jgi:HEAT repeat protein
VPDKDFTASRAPEIVERLLGETGVNNRVLRYDAARCLAIHLRAKAPEQAVTALLEMLNDKDVAKYDKSRGNLKGGNLEGRGGGADLKANVGGDARFMAADALGDIGPPKARRPEVIQALKELRKSPSEKARESAQRALTIIESGL